MKFSKISFILLTLLSSSIAMAGNPARTGDIVGRELDAWAPANNLGHVGVWDKSMSKVIEVLNEDQVIQFNSLYNFKSRVSNGYWGARGNSYFNSGSSLSSKAMIQKMYNPQYTITTQYKEGKIERKCTKWGFTGCKKYSNVSVRGKFRCDTFVHYLYKKTGNGSLIQYGAITPYVAYSKVSQTR